MLQYRDGTEVFVCDGCFEVIGPVLDDTASGRTVLISWRTPVHKNCQVGHVCSTACGHRYSEHAAVDGRAGKPHLAEPDPSLASA